MSVSTRVGLFALWILSLFVVGTLVSAQPLGRRDPAPVISGGDIGFRPEGWRGTARTGTFVVRINGEWVDAVDVMAVKNATTTR
jgi:hypothetical protein